MFLKVNCIYILIFQSCENIFYKFPLHIETVLYKDMSSKRKNTNHADSSEKKKPKTYWALGLLDTMKDPKYQVLSDEKVTVIKDKYPKAKYHYLIIPKEDISSLKRVNTKHLELLKHMDQVARKIIEIDSDHEKRTFRIGYHAQPSMIRLHLHVISDDMNSECLKTKKHWNSFITDFFLDSKAVIDELEKNGKISLASAEKCKQWMESPLKCHKCDYSPKNIPDLKKHILKH